MARKRQKDDGLLGYFEVIDQSLAARGWAKRRDSDGAVELGLAVDGTIAASALTTQRRPDLIAQGISSGPSGFSIPIPANAIRRLRSTIHVLHGEVPILPAHVLDLTASVSLSILGIEHDELKIGVEGWPGRAIKAAVKIDGIPRGTVKIPAGAGGLPAAPAELRWPVPEEYCDGAAHVYVVEIDHDDAVVRSDVSVLRYPDFRIHLDAATFEHAAGWVFQSDRAVPVSLSAWHDGVRIGSAVAQGRRPDVAASFKLGFDQVGFSFDFHEPLPGPYAEVTLRNDESGHVLSTLSIISPYEQMIDIAASHRGPAAAAFHPSAAMSEAITGSNGDLHCISRETYFHAIDCPEGEIAVIMPVYGGALELVECVESLLAAKNETPHILILVNDASPEPLISAYLRNLEKRAIPNMRVVHRAANHGFSAAVNVGMIMGGSRDTVLINADTVVCDGWLDRLVEAARQDSRIATVTPLSNNGEIATLPYICKSIPVESEATARAVNEEALRLNRGRIVDIPVAIGFCMFIRRASLEDVGLFDAEKWGRGYGEEVDFCIKAAARGWRHVLAGDSFVVHRGAVSFGDEKLQRVLEAGRKITEAYPFYDKMIQRFLKADPVAALRRPVNLALIARTLPERRVLHVSHALGGGTERYIADISSLYEDDGRSNLVLRFGRSGGATLELKPGKGFGAFFQKLHTETYRSHEIDQLLADLEALAIGTVHLHSPIGVPPEFLSKVIARRKLTITIHDYAWATPSVTFTTPAGHYFGDDPDHAEACASSFERPYPGLEPWVAISGSDIRSYRRMFDAVMRRADHVMCGCRDVAERMRACGFTAQFTVSPHPLPDSSPHAGLEMAPVPLRGGEAVRVALLGGISAIKGYSTLLACARHAEENNLPIRFLVFGYTENDAALARLPNVTILGRYDDRNIGSLLLNHRPHVSFFPNSAPETFSYTLTLAIRAGLWPVVSDIGATAERVRDSGFGNVYGLSFKPDQICKLLMDSAESGKLGMQPNAVEQPTDCASYFGSCEVRVLLSA